MVSKAGFDPLRDPGEGGKIVFRDLYFQWKGIKPSDAYTGLLLDATLEEISKTTIGYPIVEIGTGCGAIAICIGSKSPNLEVLATDIDLEQIKIARRNAYANQCSNVIFYIGNMFEPIASRAPFSLIVGNLPLKATFDQETADIHRDAGPRGTEKVVSFLQRGRGHIAPGGKILTVVNNLLLPEVESQVPSLEIVRSSEEITPVGETLVYFRKLAKALGADFDGIYRAVVVSLGDG